MTVSALFRSAEVRIRAAVIAVFLAAVAVVVVPLVLLVAPDPDEPEAAVVVPPAPWPAEVGQRRDRLYMEALRTHGFTTEDFWALRQTARDVCQLAGQGQSDDYLAGYVWERHLPPTFEDAKVFVQVVKRVYCDRSLGRLSTADGGIR